MLDTRAFDGWRRLTASMLQQAATDDPAALRQIIEHLEWAQSQLPTVVDGLRSRTDEDGGNGKPFYSWADIAAELGVTRGAAYQRFGPPRIAGCANSYHLDHLRKHGQCPTCNTSSDN